MTTVDAYRSLAPHYDRLRMDWFGPAMIDRLAELLQARELAHGSILDVGCGTGTLTLLLHELGYSMTGIDLSRSLLSLARQKSAGRSIEYLEADMTQLDLGRSFDAIVSVGDVLNHLRSIDEWSRTFVRLARHLRPGGLLFFDSLTARGLAEIDCYIVHDRPDDSMIMGIVYDPALRLSLMKLTCFTRVPESNNFVRSTESIAEWAQPAEQVLAALADAGFEAIERPWSTNANPEDDTRLTIIARRSA